MSTGISKSRQVYFDKRIGAALKNTWVINSGNGSTRKLINFNFKILKYFVVIT